MFFFLVREIQDHLCPGRHRPLFDRRVALGHVRGELVKTAAEAPE